MPEDKRLFNQGASSIASYLAKFCITDYEEGIKKYLSDLLGHLSLSGQFIGLSGEEVLIEKIHLRGKEYNTILNRSEEEWKRLENKPALQQADVAANAYLKASKGSL